MVYKFFDKKLSSGAVTSTQSKILVTRDKSIIKSYIMPNQQLGEELPKSIIRKLGKRALYSSFKDNILDAYLADMQLISKYNRISIFIMFDLYL